jgi:hypothetical protein
VCCLLLLCAVHIKVVNLCANQPHNISNPLMAIDFALGQKVKKLESLEFNQLESEAEDDETKNIFFLFCH